MQAPIAGPLAKMVMDKATPTIMSREHLNDTEFDSKKSVVLIMS